MTTNRPPFDTTMLAALAVLSVMFALVAFGCDQPPKSDRPEPISVTQPIGTALDDVAAIPPLAQGIKADGERLREFPEDSRNVAAAAPRIINRAEEIEDHARAAERTLTEARQTSLQNDRRVEVLQSHIAKLTADNAKLREQVERERQSGIRKVQLIVGGVSAVVLMAGIGLAFVSPKLGAIVAAFGAVGIGVASYFATIAAVAGVASIIGLIIGVAWLAHRNGWLDGTLRRVTQAIEQVGRANPLAGVRDVKASIAVATDDAFAAIVRDETRPAGK
jgi:hypothetical protein